MVNNGNNYSLNQTQPYIDNGIAYQILIDEIANSSINDKIAYFVDGDIATFTNDKRAYLINDKIDYFINYEINNFTNYGIAYFII